MKKNPSNEVILRHLVETVDEEIHKYAKKEKLTYEEAYSQSYFIINGKKIPTPKVETLKENYD